MKNLNLLLFSTLLLVLVACNNKNIPAVDATTDNTEEATTPQDFDANALAADFCACLETAKANKPTTIKASKNNNSLPPSSIVNCEAQITQKWGNYSSDKYQKYDVQVAMQAQCPEMATTFRKAQKGNLSASDKAAAQSKKGKTEKAKLKLEPAKQ